jgi:F-type H+-transporting ATPase subunit b
MFLAETSIQLVPDGTLLLHLLMVAVMVAVLNLTLLKPINKILEDRDKYILGKVDEAKTILQTSEQKIDEYHEALHEARTEGYQLIEKVRTQAVKEKDERVRTFREQTSREITAGIDATHLQEQIVKKELESQAEALGSMITAQILERR